MRINNVRAFNEQRIIISENQSLASQVKYQTLILISAVQQFAWLVCERLIRAWCSLPVMIDWRFLNRQSMRPNVI